MSRKYTKEELLRIPSIEVYKLLLKKDIGRFPSGFFMQSESKENAILCVRFMVEEKLKWTDEEIKEKLSYQIFRDNKLGGMLSVVFNNSPYYAINSVYPNKFKPWDFKNVPLNFWTLENGIEATKWLIEEKLKWNKEDIKGKLSQKTFKDNNLYGMLQYVFNNSPYDAINLVYPNEFKQWEVKNTPMGFWNLENGIEATKWLVESKCKWTDSDIKEKLSYKLFKENNLGGMLQYVFNSSPYKAINSVYPNKFKPWEVKNTPRDFWTLETGVNAIKWLIEEKLKWTDEDIKEKLSFKIFKENNLGGMLQYVFNSSPYRAINTIYPSRFKKEDLKSYQYNVTKDR